MRDIRNSRKAREMYAGPHGRRFKRMIRRVYGKLLKMFEPGRSKHIDKINNNGKPLIDKIYSYGTLESYMSVCFRFFVWVFNQYSCFRIDEAINHVPAYLNMRINRKLSAWTIHLDASAIAKLYQCSYIEFGVELPVRRRSDVKKNKIERELLMQYEEEYSELAEFCKSSGLRRKEMKTLKPNEITSSKNGDTFVYVRCGKGGKKRTVKTLRNYPIKLRDRAIANGQEKVFDEIPADVPIHIWRKQFAQTLYHQLARPIETLKREQRYSCKRDMKGKVFDRAAMYEVSRQLGHERLGVVTTYLNDVFLE